MVLSRLPVRHTGKRSSMTRGMAGGQTSSVSLTGVLRVPTSCKLRRTGDPKTMLRQRRHTCTNDCHASILFFEVGSSPTPKSNILSRTSNIASRTSSGSVSIGVTWPTSHQVSQWLLLRDALQVQLTYIQNRWFLLGCQSSDVHDSLLSMNILNRNSLGPMIQGGQDMMEEGKEEGG